MSDETTARVLLVPFYQKQPSGLLLHSLLNRNGQTNITSKRSFILSKEKDINVIIEFKCAAVFAPSCASTSLKSRSPLCSQLCSDQGASFLILSAAYFTQVTLYEEASIYADKSAVAQEVIFEVSCWSPIFRVFLCVELALIGDTSNW